MLSHHFSSSLSIIILFFFILLVDLLRLSLADDQAEINNKRYSRCSTLKFNCGDQQGIGYPFYGSGRPAYCGHSGYKLDCRNGLTQIESMSAKYQVLRIDEENKIIRIVNMDFLDDVCPSEFSNTTGNSNLFSFPGVNLNLFYGCPTQISPPHGFATYKFTCTRNSSTDSNRDDAYYLAPMHGMAEQVLTLFSQCDMNVQVPMMNSDLVRLTSNATLLVSILRGGFELNYSSAGAANFAFCDGCFGSGGQCGFDSTLNQHICFCHNGTANSQTFCRATMDTQGGENYVFYYCYQPQPGVPFAAQNPPSCLVVELPLSEPPSKLLSDDWFTLLDADFILEWHVLNSRDADTAGSGSRRKKIAIGIAAGVAGVIIASLVIIIICCCMRRKYSLHSHSKTFWRKKFNENGHQNMEVFFRNCGSLAPKRYMFSDVKKMTNSFEQKLGEGGFGTVFKGQLHDGMLVAVKVLFSKSEKDGEDFINEVASISRTSHVNIVTLHGFCFEKKKMALIYEFMPNGSLEKFIYNKAQSDQLGWETVYQISIGIARGLEYLHRGCNTQILHFGIKPHNVLLDQDFCPKISDFGLAKLCPRKESMVSILGARGTLGYIAPEVCSRNIGRVSYKSDVYSYGMMLLEMVGGRKNIDMNVGMDHSSQLYFPHWIHERLEKNEDLGLHAVLTLEREELARKMIIVGLWCIQTNPLSRPSMSQVLEMLEGTLEALQIPPKPMLFSSPATSPPVSSSAIVSIS